MQEPDQHPYLRGVGALEQALGLAGAGFVRIDLRVAGRHQHTELEPDLVLLRRLVVGVQQVPLVQDRVCHLAGMVQVVCGQAHAWPSARSAASDNSARIVASHVARPLAVLKLTRSLKVSMLSLSHAVLGKWASIASRQTLTGSR